MTRLSLAQLSPSLFTLVCQIPTSTQPYLCYVVQCPFSHFVLFQEVACPHHLCPLVLPELESVPHVQGELDDQQAGGAGLEVAA